MKALKENGWLVVGFIGFIILFIMVLKLTEKENKKTDSAFRGGGGGGHHGGGGRWHGGGRGWGGGYGWGGYWPYPLYMGNMPNCPPNFMWNEDMQRCDVL